MDQWTEGAYCLVKRMSHSDRKTKKIISGKRTVTPDTALRLAKFTETEAEFWVNMQQAVDLWDALHSAKSSWPRGVGKGEGTFPHRTGGGDQ
jgi:addiction module HigA family antidote